MTTNDRPEGSAARELDRITEALKEQFRASRSVLSFREYLALFGENPRRHGRDAATYVRDLFDHYGSEPVEQPWGRGTRYRLFDQPWEANRGERETLLVGQEDVQAAIYRNLSNFVREGRANKLVLLHGPNGSAKSTTAACILNALEHYSTIEEGALYRFHWVFPSRKMTRGSIGFGGERPRAEHASDDSFAHLADDQIDARLVMEVRDHPLWLIPVEPRRALLASLFTPHGIEPPAWLVSGRLSHKNQRVFEALMMAEEGDLARVLRHVQVERWFISRKYRQGAVTLGPELRVDAGERQITADRSLAALPTALQATTLFEAHGELVEAAGGVLEFSDLLKRPLDAFRYLQLTLETGEVALPQQNVQTNVVMIGSANEVHLAAFREHHEFPSFRGRFELVPVPYLRSSIDERRIYDRLVVPFVGVHVAPHAVAVAAEFAVMTRLLKPDPSKYSAEEAKIVRELTVEQKLDLYAMGRVPDALDGDAKKVLRAALPRIHRETEASLEYEGHMGVSPRAMRTVLLNAAQHPDYGFLSPFAVLHELDELCKQTSEYDFLRLEPKPGGYHDTKELRAIVRRRLLDRLEVELRAASGLVEDVRWAELFDRYVQHVSTWVKGETIRNPVTGEHEKADEKLLREVEGLLGVTQRHEDHRRALISSIAAWAIDHPGERVVNEVVFPELLGRLKTAVYAERRKPVALLVRDYVRLGRSAGERGPDKDLSEGRRRDVAAMRDRLFAMGYDERSALDAASSVLQARFAELVL